MPRKGHSEEQIVYALRQVEGGQKVSEVCREMGVSLSLHCRFLSRNCAQFCVPLQGFTPIAPEQHRGVSP